MTQIPQKLISIHLLSLSNALCLGVCPANANTNICRTFQAFTYAPFCILTEQAFHTKFTDHVFAWQQPV